MIEQGNARAPGFSVEEITRQWATLLFEILPSRLEARHVRRWRGRSLRLKQTSRRLAQRSALPGNRAHGPGRRDRENYRRRPRHCRIDDGDLVRRTKRLRLPDPHVTGVLDLNVVTNRAHLDRYCRKCAPADRRTRASSAVGSAHRSSRCSPPALCRRAASRTARGARSVSPADRPVTTASRSGSAPVTSAALRGRGSDQFGSGSADR